MVVGDEEGHNARKVANTLRQAACQVIAGEIKVTQERRVDDPGGDRTGNLVLLNFHHG